MPQVIPAIPYLLQAAGVITGATAAYATVGMLIGSPVYGTGRPISKTFQMEASNELN